MKLVFCGTPQFAVPTLNALADAGHEIALTISQPDKPVGRAGEIHPTPVKQAAMARGIAVTQPLKLKTNEDLHAQLRAIAPDAIVVVAYGRILPKWMLDLPRFGCINGHGSLLPRWRGAAPIQWAIASGDSVTGVTTMRLDEGLDTGDMLLKQAVPITATTTSPELFASLAHVGADLMLQTLAGLEYGTIRPEKQNDTEATHAPILTREDGRIDFARTATQIHQRFRGFQPWPGAYAILGGRKLIVHAMRVAEMQTPPAPGAFREEAGAMLVGCGGDTAIAFDEVQPEGKRRMSAADFLRGSHAVERRFE